MRALSQCELIMVVAGDGGGGGGGDAIVTSASRVRCEDRSNRKSLLVNKILFHSEHHPVGRCCMVIHMFYCFSLNM